VGGRLVETPWASHTSSGRPPEGQDSGESTSVTDAAEVAGPLAMLLQVVCHVRCP
jgi:hypothetical protein